MSRRVFVLRQAMSPAEQPHTARSGRCAALSVTPARDARRLRSQMDRRRRTTTRERRRVSHARRCRKRVNRHARRCPAWRVAGESSRATLPCMARRA